VIKNIATPNILLIVFVYTQKSKFSIIAHRIKAVSEKKNTESLHRHGLYIKIFRYSTLAAKINAGQKFAVSCSVNIILRQEKNFLCLKTNNS
jgi:hypothetical protein